jgi:hypothetical protein
MTMMQRFPNPRFDAIRSLVPGAQLSMQNDVIIDWQTPGVSQPSEAEIDAEIVRLAHARSIPTSCGPAQAKIVLWEMGLLDQVEVMIGAHPYKPVSIWYHAATVWERAHPYIAALGYELDLTDEDIDDLFALAVTK